ncbi:MAG: hypothetical protein PF572_05900 [Patescibacteria group bacterium]|jgi:hypothetical protein|nr:hypothetical protein [Patescibacteria group bacterium]
MKKLEFAAPLPDLILKGEKTNTWRINDKRGISENDELSLCYVNGNKFARARVLSTNITTSGELNESDKKGHEVFKNKKEIYETYSKYYNIGISSETEVKIIKLKIVK